METYDQVASQTTRQVIRLYSTSFGLASRLFSRQYRQHVYNIYGFVRMADEIVDSYHGDDSRDLLQDLENETYAAISRGFSTNLVLHAFAETARTCGIDQELIGPFYGSMRIDLPPGSYAPERYDEYIYGSAEVVGLMCLRVFCGADTARYDRLAPGARSLGAAFQKVNFLRDIRDDYEKLGRYYFPIGSYDSFDDKIKREIVDSIRADFARAVPAISELPRGAGGPVRGAYAYYTRLLSRLEKASAHEVASRRVRISNALKVALLARTMIGERVKR